MLRRLVLMMVCLTFLVLPTVSSQSYVTITTTSTLLVTYTAGSGVITSFLQGQTLVSDNFTVNPVTGNYSCTASSFPFIANRGQHVSGEFSSDNPVDFYIMTDTNYQNWPHAAVCESPSDAIIDQPKTTSYSFNVTIPSYGKWDIVLVNSSKTSVAHGPILVYSSLGNVTYMAPVLATSTLTSLFQVTQPSQFTSSELTNSTPQLLLALAAIATVVLGALFLYEKREKRNASG